MTAFRRLLLTALMGLATLNLFAQGKITGKVVDKQSSQAMPYVAVTVLKAVDSSVVAGALTGENGSFSIAKVPQGEYLVRIASMGYKTVFQPLSLTNGANANMGRIAISAQPTMIDNVVVEAERSMVEYKLDKRVVNVDKNIVAGGGTATDVLESVPSVALDSDGNVTLRGSSNVKVLINGRPYELMGSDLQTLLEQIPATTVENVEVITNPSAKYDPEGMSGIINLKLKESPAGALGWNGIVNINGGTPLWFGIPDNMPQFIPTTMGSLNLNYGTEKLTFSLSADAGLRSRGNQSWSYFERYRKVGDSRTMYSNDSLYESGLHRNRMGSVKAGLEYRINKHNTLNLSYSLRGGMRQRQSIVDGIDLLNADHLLDYTQADTNSTGNHVHLVGLSYKRTFDKPEQELTFDATLSFKKHNAEGWQEQLYANPLAWQHYYLRETETHNRNNTFNFHLNYTHPFSDKLRLETGYESRMTFTNQNYLQFLSTYNADTNIVKEQDMQASKNFIFQQQVHAVYATFAATLSSKLSAQAGLRGEYSFIDGKDMSHSDVAIRKDYYQLYPTLHLSYEIDKAQSLQLSYSRRVRRPMMWDLLPNLEVSEGEQLYFGNPGLDPEFTNAFELSYNLGFKQTNIFTSLYFRQTNNMMTRYGYIWDAQTAALYSPWMLYNADYDGYWASTWQNLNRGINAGMEIILDQQIAKWWKVNLSVNLYQSYIEGTELLDNQDKKAFRASGKLSSYMSLPHDWTIQISGQYRAPFMDLQTDMMASYWADLAVKKDLWGKRATLSLRVQDFLCTAGFGHTTDNEQLYRAMRSKRLSPMVTLGFSYKINKGLQQKPKEMDGDGDEDM